MPIYEYRCSQCRKEFEILVRGGEQARCPACASVKLERQLSVVAAPSSAGASPSPGSGEPASGLCGRPQCGTFGCQGLN